MFSLQKLLQLTLAPALCLKEIILWSLKPIALSKREFQTFGDWRNLKFTDRVQWNYETVFC